MLTDENLALSIKQGDGGALSLLVERHYSGLKGYLYRMTAGNLALSEDMAQETFLRVLRGIDYYSYPRPFKTWLYAIATNVARNYFKRADTRHTDSVADEEMRMIGDARLDPEAALLMDEETRQVVQALAQLPTHQREVIVLRYYQEHSLAEIAEILDIPLGTVKSRLNIGLQRLRDAMMEEQHETR